MTKTSVKKHRIVLMLDMKYFSEFWRSLFNWKLIFCTSKSNFNYIFRFSYLQIYEIFNCTFIYKLWITKHPIMLYFKVTVENVNFWLCRYGALDGHWTSYEFIWIGRHKPLFWCIKPPYELISCSYLCHIRDNWNLRLFTLTPSLHSHTLTFLLLYWPYWGFVRKCIWNKINSLIKLFLPYV